MSKKKKELGFGAVPVTGASSDSRLVSVESMLEVVEDGKLITRHDIVVRLGLNLVPDAGDGLVENLANGGIRGASRALASNLESLGHIRHDG